MKAICLQQYGSQENLKYEDISQPGNQPGKIIVKVKAASVNHLEIVVASGKMQKSMPVTFPWIPGYDFAGIVESTGSSHSGYAPGDEVYAKCTGGSYAEYIVADPDILAHKPADISFTAAASVPHTGLTAWQALYEHGNLRSGQKVLIHGAAGGVGMFVVQFAKYTGAFVYGTASQADMAFVKELQADRVIDYKNEDFTTIVKDVDLVIDLVGGETQSRSFGILKKGGRLVTTTGKIDNPPDNAGIEAINMVVHPDGKALEEITGLIQKKRVKTDVAKVYPLAEAPEAWKTFNHQTPAAKEFTHGKIVLEI